jgi:hypothetical protein
MVPQLLALNAAADTKSPQTPSPKLPLEKKLMWGAILGVVVIGGALIIRKGVKKLIDSQNEKKQDEAVLKDPNPPTEAQRAKAIEQANIIYKALFENDFFGFSEDEAKVLETAKQITHWKTVSSAYAKKFKRNLLNDVRKYLDDAEFSKFMQYANRQPNP